MASFPQNFRISPTKRSADASKGFARKKYGTESASSFTCPV
jgi:hypothetical protein